MKRLFTIALALSLSHLFGQIEVAKDTLQADSLINESLAFDTVKSLPTLTPGQYVEYVDSFYYATEALQKKINFTNCPELVNGYRLQILSCSGEGCKEKANKYYSQFLIAYPHLAVYKMWQAPTIKVRVGDCRSRFDAEKIKSEIKADFPYVFIVPDHIESPYKIDCEDMKISESDSLLIVPLRRQ